MKQKQIRVSGCIPSEAAAKKAGKIANPGYTQRLTTEIVGDLIYHGYDSVKLTAVGAQAHSNMLQGALRANFELGIYGFKLGVDNLGYEVIELKSNRGEEKTYQAKAVAMTLTKEKLPVVSETPTE